MAYTLLEDQLEEEKKQQELGPLQPQSAGPAVGQEGVVSPTGGADLPEPTQVVGQFSNLQRYVTANAPQAEVLAGQVAGEIGREATEARSAIQGAEEQFGQQVTSNTQQYDSNLIGDLSNAPIEFEQTPEKVEALRRLQSGTYGGPASFGEAGLQDPITKEVGEAQKALKMTETPYGTRELVRSLPQEGPQQMRSRGSLALDQLLLQNVQPAYEKVQSAVGEAKTIGEEQAASQARADAAVAAAREQATSVSEQTRQGLVGAETEFQSGINARVDQQRAALAAQEAGARGALRTGGTAVSPAQLQALGVTQAQWNGMVALQNEAKGYGGGANLESYFSATPGEAVYTPQTVATPQEIARYQALTRLMGGPNAGNYLRNPQAAMYQNPLNFDISRINEMLGGQIAVGKGQRQAQTANEQIIAQQMASANAQKAAQKKQQTMSAVGTAVGIAVAVFCFAAGTKIVMQNGTIKNVEDLDLGDDMLLGGRVTTLGKGLAVDLYEYKGIFVEGSHHVFCRDGTWRSVSELPEARQVECDGAAVVYPVVNERHAMLIKGDEHVIAADFGEIDDVAWEYNAAQRFEIMCNDEKKREWLLKCYDVIDGKTNPVEVEYVRADGGVTELTATVEAAV